MAQNEASSWNDDRFDELSLRVAEGFKETREGFARAEERFAVREETNRRFDEVDRRFDEVDRRFDEVDKKFETVDRRFQEVLTQLGRVNDRLDDYVRIVFVASVGLFGAVLADLLHLV